MHPLLSDVLSIVGLIATYRQLKDGRLSGAKADSAFEFLTWLHHAGLDEIGDKIRESAELQAALEEILTERHSELRAKLETIEDAVRSVAGKLEGFAALAGSPREEYLSDQACEFLRLLDATQTGEVLCHQQTGLQMISFLSPGAGSYHPPEPRFFGDDLDKLAMANWIKPVRFNKHGQPIYAITRRGSAAAKRLIS